MHHMSLRPRVFSVRRRGPQTGSILLVVMVALVALMACAALTIDLGGSMVAASRCQALADAAALAAAAGTIAGQSTAVNARIQDIMDANAQVRVPTTWSAGELVTYTGGATVPGYGAIGSTDEAITVTVHINANFGFARLVGINSKDIARSATALRKVGSAGGALFFAIDSSTTKTGIDIAGSSDNFKGLLHSNTRVVITGSAHHFWDWVEWVNRMTSGSGYTWDKGYRQGVVKPDPLAYLTPDSFAPFDYTINGNYSMTGSDKTVPPGVYRVHGNVSISGSNQTANNVTFVADGEIGATGSNFHYSANRLGMFAYTTSTDMTGAIAVAGSGADCVGGLYAPHGDIDFSGSANGFVRTSVVGYQIDVTGSDFSVEPTPNFGATSTSVSLIR